MCSALFLCVAMRFLAVESVPLNLPRELNITTGIFDEFDDDIKGVASFSASC